MRLLVKNMLRLMLIFYPGVMMTACAGSTISWHEEVRLLDSRIIVVKQQRRYEQAYNGSNFGGVERESWLTIKLPETGNQETTWHENLIPSNLNVVNGKLYIVGMPPTGREFYLYNKPRPPYIGYAFENNAWRRIPFTEIPEEMYDMNMSFYSKDYIQDGRITLPVKVKALKTPGLPKSYKRINPSYKSNADSEK